MVDLDNSDKMLYVGMDAGQQKEFNKITRFLHTAGSDGEGDQFEDESSAGWD